jgi:hypothetical protein
MVLCDDKGQEIYRKQSKIKAFFNTGGKFATGAVCVFSGAWWKMTHERT